MTHKQRFTNTCTSHSYVKSFFTQATTSNSIQQINIKLNLFFNLVIIFIPVIRVFKIIMANTIIKTYTKSILHHFRNSTLVTSFISTINNFYRVHNSIMYCSFFTPFFSFIIQPIIVY